LICQLPGFGSEWLLVVGLGLVLVGGLILVSALWKRISLKEPVEQDTGFAELQEAKNRRMVLRTAQATEAQLSPDMNQKSDAQFGKRPIKIVVLGQKRERGGLVIAAGIICAGFLLGFIGSLPCP
jgi:hypothetical protein